MSNLDRLPAATMVETAPPGYCNRQRVAVAGADVETLDAEVIAAGGRIERRPMPKSQSVRRQRGVRSTQQARHVSWYVIPDSALG